MEATTIELVKQMKVANVEQKGSFQTEFAEIPYYVVESDDTTLRFWNSSDHNGIHQFAPVLDEIREKVLDEEESGSFHDGWCEVMWEII